MAKTNPIGVRFNEELLNTLKESSIADSPQKALNLYERTYVESINKKVIHNNIPENKEQILIKRNEKQKEKLSHFDLEEIQERIKILEFELSHPAKNPLIGIKTWINVRENELSTLKNKLNEITT